jgi:hypothetical protein
MSATDQTAGTMIDCRAGAHLLGSCYSPQLLTSRKPNNDEAHSRVKAGVQAAEVKPWRCSTASARGWWKHVSRRVRLHSRTSLRVICQYGAPHARAYGGFTTPSPPLPVLLVRGITLHKGVARLLSRLHLLTAALRPVALYAQLLLVRPLARACHVEGAQRLAGPRVQFAPPRQKPLLLSTARSTYSGARVTMRAWVVRCAPLERASEQASERLGRVAWSDSDVSCLTSHCGKWPRCRCAR